MEFKKATLLELDDILVLYDNARRFMRETGNLTQWQNGYPNKNLIAEDIKKGQLYILEDNGEISAVFVYFKGVEPDYEQIDGKWLNDKPYGVLHRICVAKKGNGIAAKCFEFAYLDCKNLKIDTFPDNKIMQHTLEKNGFVRCGTVLVDKINRCIAYQKSGL